MIIIIPFYSVLFYLVCKWVISRKYNQKQQKDIYRISLSSLFPLDDFILFFISFHFIRFSLSCSHVFLSNYNLDQTVNNKTK